MKEKVTTRPLSWESCPACGASWDGGSILETFVQKREAGEDMYKDMSDQDLIKMVREFYGDGSARWKRYIGIEIPGEYDGILYVQCPDCQATYHRFTGTLQEDLHKHGSSPGLGESPST